MFLINNIPLTNNETIYYLKSNLILIVLLIVLLFVVAIIVKKIINFNSKDNELSQNEKEIQLSINDSLVQELYSYVSTEVTSPIESYNFSNYLFKNKKLTIESFDTKQLYIYSFRHIDKNKIQIISVDNSNDIIYIPRDAYEKAIEKVFNIKPIFDPNLEFKFMLLDSAVDSLYNGGFEFSYDSEKDAYVSIDGDVGATLPTLYRKLVKAYKNNNDIILKEKFIYIGGFFDDGYLVCLDSYCNNVVKTEVDKSPLDINIDMYKDITNTLPYTFKLGNDNEYHYYSSVIDN